MLILAGLSPMFVIGLLLFAPCHERTMLTTRVFIVNTLLIFFRFLFFASLLDAVQTVVELLRSSRSINVPRPLAEVNTKKLFPNNTRLRTPQ